MKRIQEALYKKNKKCGNILFIAIDGHGGSGKSTLADLVSKQLNAQIIHTDDFASWKNPLDWWADLKEKVFVPIQNGAKQLSYSRSQWWEGHKRELVVGQPVTNIMILEGVSALRKEFDEYIGFGIFVDTPRETCLERGVERDMKLGKDRKEVIKMWQGFLEEEDEYMNRDNPKKKADVIIDGTIPFINQ